MSSLPSRTSLTLHSAALAAAFALTAQGALAQAPASPLQGHADAGAVLARQTCAACHGADGNPTAPSYPRLAGQFPEYIAKQLRSFKAPAGQRAHRASAIMQPLAATLSEQQIVDLAAYYAKQKPGTFASVNTELVEAGRKIYFQGNPSNDLPACVSCHRPDGSGIAPDFPRLTAQDPTYVAEQLRNWEAQRGGRGKLMTMIVPHMRPADIDAVAQFIAQMK